MYRWILLPCIAFTFCVNNMIRNQDFIEQHPQTVKADSYFLTGKFSPDTCTGFVRIADIYSARPDMYMQSEAYEAFLKMAEAAATDSLSLCILSATRNFDYQKEIWEAKWTGRMLLDDEVNAATSYPGGKERALKILEYSAMPGTSRHHWGTDIDLNSLDNAYFDSDGLALYGWLVANASKYGYYQTYTAIGPERPYGYNEEKWHWSYLPLSRYYTHKLADYLTANKVHGFLGDEFCDSLPILDHFVLGINPACK